MTLPSPDFYEHTGTAWDDVEIFCDWFLTIVFLIPTTLLNLYATAKVVNVLQAVISTRFFTDDPEEGGLVPRGEEPMVTIQISCFNEGNVIEETINAACKVDWPKDKLCVQICDDSTDETVVIIEEIAERWRQRGVMCERVFRPPLAGDKAGCLSCQIDKVQGDFVAMFDADHRCEPQFLRRCIPQFYDSGGNSMPQVGLVQCPWGYYNTHTNLLTEYDALSLDAAFVLEQTGRAEFALGIFSFNGTGGVWRKDAIRAGGGWSWETLPEDLDLSYERRMAGYEFVYLRNLPQQLELPSGIRAHVQQKFRWTKGFFQVARRTLWRILCNPSTPLRLKSEVFFQFTGAACYSLTLVVVLLVPIMAHRDLFTIFLTAYTLAPTAVPLLAGLCTIFGKASGSNGQYKTFLSRLYRCLFIPTLYTFALGMMVFETYAMCEGWKAGATACERESKDGELKGLSLDYADDDHRRRGIDSESDRDLERSKGGGRARTKSSGSSVASNRSRHSSQVAPENKESRLSYLLKRSRCFPKLSRKAQKFKTNFTNGLLGLALACYLYGWCLYLYVDKIESGPVRHDPCGVLIIFLLPLPAIGLFYIHGMFVWALLSSKFKKRMKKRANQDAKLRALRSRKQHQKKTPTVVKLPEDAVSMGTTHTGLATSLRSHSPHTITEIHQNDPISANSSVISSTPSGGSKSSSRWSRGSRSSGTGRRGLQGQTSFRGLKSTGSVNSPDSSIQEGISSRRPQYVLVPDSTRLPDSGKLTYGDLAEGEIIVL